MPITTLSLAVVGADYPNKRGPARRFEIALCVPGESVELRPEPRNPADPRALAVFSARGIQLGYLTAERAPWIKGMLANGREVRAVFQVATRHGAVIRVGLDGVEPVLPEVGEEVGDESDQDFFPDETWPDE